MNEYFFSTRNQKVLMNFKRFALLAALGLAGQLHAATPEAALNAARVADADYVTNVNATKIP